MKQVFILVEGQTEERFCKDVLMPHFRPKGIYLTPIILRTRVDPDGTTYRGGVGSYKKIKQDLIKLLRNPTVCCVTTMIDYYRIPDDFPGKHSVSNYTNPYQKVAHLENAFKNDINNSRFLPFIVLHEFESLLLADPSEIARAGHFSKNEFKNFMKHIGNRSPEEVNDGENTHPAALIKTFFSKSKKAIAYRKSLDGPSIASKIGLPKIRSHCRHFNDWITRLENLTCNCP